jgi:hypothetical protein
MAYGVWGIADRELGERGSAGSSRALWFLRAVRIVAALTGAMAAVTAMLTALALALGRMIS